jgi:hypothetical protein
MNGGRAMPRAWTTGELRTLRSWLNGVSLREIAEQLGRSRAAVKSHATVIGLRRGTHKPFSASEIKKLREIFPHMTSQKVAVILGRNVHAVERKAHSLGLRKTPSHLASPDACRLRRGDQVGRAFRFPKGHVPANKGLRRPGYSLGRGRMRETQFKKGERSGAAQAKWCPVGTIKMRDGYLMMKVKDEHQDIAGKGAHSTNWMYVHKMVWESERGMIQRGHRIWWKDGNHENCAIENLELLSDVEHMKRTTIQNWPVPLRQVAMLTGALKRKIKIQIRKRGANDRAKERGNEKQDVRSARPSVCGA